MTILIVDDDKMSLMLAKIMLQNILSKNINVIEAIDGNDGFNKYIKNKDQINLIITDNRMPVCDGETFIKNVRQVDATTPIVFMSANNVTCEENAVYCIDKPLRNEKIETFLKHFDLI